jgi:hypothetical protein
MKGRTTLILVGVFALLLVFVYLVEWRQPPQTTTTPTPASLWHVESDQIIGLAVQESGRETRLVRSGSGDWSLELPESGPADSDRVTLTLGNLAALTPQRTFTETTTLAEYGLDHPTMTVTVRLKDGTAQVLFVGSENPQQTAYYVQVQGSSPVHLLSSWEVESLRELLDTPPVQPTPTPRPTETPGT